MNYMIAGSKSSCGFTNSLAYTVTKQKIFFCICALCCALLFLVIGKFENKKHVFVGIIISGTFFLFFSVLGVLTFEVGDEVFYLTFCSCSSK